MLNAYVIMIVEHFAINTLAVSRYHPRKILLILDTEVHIIKPFFELPYILLLVWNLAACWQSLKR